MKDLKQKIKRMDKDKLFVEYLQDDDFIIKHEDDTISKNGNMQIMAVYFFVEVIGVAAIMLCSIWGFNKTIPESYLLIAEIIEAIVSTLLIGLSAYELCTLNLREYKADQAELKRAKAFKVAVNSVYPGFHAFVMKHKDEGFVPPHATFPKQKVAEPIPLSLEELVQDPDVARLLESEEEEITPAKKPVAAKPRKTKTDLITGWYQKRIAEWNLDDNEPKERRERAV